MYRVGLRVLIYLHELFKYIPAVRPRALLRSRTPNDAHKTILQRQAQFIQPCPEPILTLTDYTIK